MGITLSTPSPLFRQPPLTHHPGSSSSASEFVSIEKVAGHLVAEGRLPQACTTLNSSPSPLVSPACSSSASEFVSIEKVAGHLVAEGRLPQALREEWVHTAYGMSKDFDPSSQAPSSLFLFLPTAPCAAHQRLSS
ncbi:unnamed protein product [Closterium sp. NIES-54]